MDQIKELKEKREELLEKERELLKQLEETRNELNYIEIKIEQIESTHDVEIGLLDKEEVEKELEELKENNTNENENEPKKKRKRNMENAEYQERNNKRQKRRRENAQKIINQLKKDIETSNIEDRELTANENIIEESTVDENSLENGIKLYFEAVKLEEETDEKNKQAQLKWYEYVEWFYNECTKVAEEDCVMPLEARARVYKRLAEETGIKRKAIRRKTTEAIEIYEMMKGDRRVVSCLNMEGLRGLARVSKATRQQVAEEIWTKEVEDEIEEMEEDEVMESDEDLYSGSTTPFGKN